MLVRRDGHTDLDAPTRAEPIEDLLFHDYYSRTPRLRLTASSSPDASSPNVGTEVVLDGTDVTRLVECAIRHPSLNMKHAVLTAIWNHPESFQQIFRFGLEAAPAFSDIRDIVAAELARSAAPSHSPSAGPVRPTAETLLPRLPLPPHLRVGKGNK
jgi:hypothetical protein